MFEETEAIQEIALIFILGFVGILELWVKTRIYIKMFKLKF